MRDDKTMDLFLGRPTARRADPETSHEAADSVSLERVRMTQRRVLLLIDEHGPSTDEQLALHWRWDPVSPSGLRTRRHELVSLGLVAWAGSWQTMRTGRKARVWGRA